VADDPIMAGDAPQLSDEWSVKSDTQPLTLL